MTDGLYENNALIHTKGKKILYYIKNGGSGVDACVALFLGVL